MRLQSFFVLLSLAALAGCTWPSDDVGPRELVYSGPNEENASRLFTPDEVNNPLSDPPAPLSEERLQDGWITLFDGQTLFGWVANSDTDWNVIDGAIVSDSKTPGLLLTTALFRDYELHCEVWLEPGGNSGLFLRTVAHPQGPAEGCLELNLCDGHKAFPSGSLVDRFQAEGPVKIEGGWHAVDVVVRGKQVVVKIDGRTVLDANSAEFTKTGGERIGLQQNGGEVRFRNIMLKPLGLESIMAAESLAGWHAAPKGTELQVTNAEGGVRIQGEGYLESDEQYEDFVLRFAARMNAADANSGLFFRAQPSTADAPSNGYELQLQNTIAGGDRTDPADYGDGFGTGAIFRRQAARYVNADDGEWFYVTLAAHGGHFSTWVNGLQVTDFIDNRPLHENPRRGRRYQAGHLSIQGHDPGTDISIRGVQINEFDRCPS